MSIVIRRFATESEAKRMVYSIPLFAMGYTAIGPRKVGNFWIATVWK